MHNLMRRILSAAVVATLVACGGGGGGNFAGIDRLGVTTGTITGFGSIIVNGVEYATTGATFNIDDNPTGLLSSLEVGQTVTVRWSSSDDGVTRRADEVFYDDSVEGPITAASINPLTQSFVVLGQTVLVDADTSFASPLFDLGSLQAGDFVKVSGLLDKNGAVRATRIERKAAGGEIEIHGIVSARTATTFAIDGQVVDTATAIIDAPGGVINDGDFVEAKGTAVNGAGQLIATRVELEDGSDAVGESGDEAEVEGYVDSFTDATSFSVAGIPVVSNVTATGGTVALNAKVRVEGEFNASGAIVAQEVEVRTGADGSAVDARIAANLDSFTATTGHTGQVVLLGVTVLVDANTRLEDQRAPEVRDFSLTDLQAGATPDYLEIRGIAQGNNTVRATLLQRQEPDLQGLLRGPLAALNDPDFTILGVLVKTDNSTDFGDVANFFGGDAVVGDEVAVKFPLNLPGGASTPILEAADEVEIESSN